MTNKNKLFLLSMGVMENGFVSFEELVGKPPAKIHIAFIENAADIVAGSAEWLPGIRQPWIDRGYQVELIDLRQWINGNNKMDLREELVKHDVIWVGGGHTYYLRWILKVTGADEVIISLVGSGKVYVGWSAGAVIAGPSIKHFDKMGDNPLDAPEQIYSGLNLMEEIVVPHMDHPDFADGAKAASVSLRAEGFKTIEMNDGEFFVPQVSYTSKPHV